MAESAGSSEGRGRVVLVPYSLQGHLTPMLQLASILDSKGFSVTIAHTKFNSPDPSNFPKFRFLALSDKLEGVDTSFYNILNLMTVMNTNCEVSFEDHMVEMLETEEVTCVIYDGIMRFVDVVANRLKLPTLVLRTTSAAYMHAHLPLFQLQAQKCLPLPESQMQVSIPNMYPLRFKDLPVSPSEEIPEAVLEFLLSYMDIKSSSAVIWNTVGSLDDCPLKKLQQHWSVPFFPMGPFHKMAQPLRTSLMEEDSSCLSWLDKQAPNSVIYVSLGSVAVIDEKDLCEIAWGLARSGHPFLWVVRPSLLNGADAIGSLPEDFKERAREKGLIVKWAPQKRVLAHSSVGGFLSHCGWNSTLESLCEGVPMICKPCFADQTTNARYLTLVWKVGLDLENTSIEQAVKTLMDSESSKDIRKHAFEMKLELESCMRKGGSSSESLDELVKFIVSLSDRK